MSTEVKALDIVTADAALVLSGINGILTANLRGNRRCGHGQIGDARASARARLNGLANVESLNLCGVHEGSEVVSGVRSASEVLVFAEVGSGNNGRLCEAAG